MFVSRVANDRGHDIIFELELEGCSQPHDCLWSNMVVQQDLSLEMEI